MLRGCRQRSDLVCFMIFEGRIDTAKGNKRELVSRQLARLLMQWIYSCVFLGKTSGTLTSGSKGHPSRYQAKTMKFREKDLISHLNVCFSISNTSIYVH